MKLEKNGVIKDIEQESIIADYILAGWKKVEAKKTAKIEREVKYGNL